MTLTTTENYTERPVQGRGINRTFTIRKPYQVALRLVKQTLMQHGLHVPAELDVALRIKRELGASVAPCTILFVDDPALLLEGIVFQRGSALGIPRRLIVSQNGANTEVCLAGTPHSEIGPHSYGIERPAAELQRRVASSLEAIAEPEEEPSLASS